MDVTRSLSVKANARHFKFDVKEFREFFKIDYAPNLGDIFQQFYDRFNEYIPEEVNLYPTRLENELVIRKLNKNDYDNNVCCYALKRNPIVEGIQYHRTIFNAEKCRRLKMIYMFIMQMKTQLVFALEMKMNYQPV